MLLYWMIFLGFAVGALVHQRWPAARQRTLLFTFLATTITALMIGFRWKIGPDWHSYLVIFNYTKVYSFSQSITHADPGFFLLQWVLHGEGAPFWIENVVCGSVFALGLASFCRRQVNPWLAYILAFPYLVIVIGMSGNRQSLALGFLFFALNAFERGQLIRFSMLVLIGALFHGSVLLMLPLGLLSYTTNQIRRLILLVITIALGFYFFRETFSIYALRYGSDRIQSSGAIFRLTMNAIPAAIFLINKKWFYLNEHQKTLWRNISTLSLLFLPLLAIAPSSTAVDRMALYFFPLQFVVFSQLPSLHRDKESPIVLVAVIAYAAAIQFVFLFFGTFARYYVPYTSILQR